MLSQNISEAFSSLLSAKVRTFLALIGIFVGTGAVAAMISVGAMARQSSLKIFEGMGTNIVMISSRMDTEFTRDSLLKAEGLAEHCPGICEVAPFGWGRAQVKFNGGKKRGGLFGITPSFFTVNRLSMKSGRFIHTLDHKTFHCVIGHDMEIFIRAQGVKELEGTQILVQDRMLTIVGVLARTPQKGFATMPINQAILVPAAVSFNLCRSPDKNLTMSTFARTEKFGPDQIKAQILSYYGKVSGGLFISFAETLIAMVNDQKKIFTQLLGFVSLVSLFVGGVGVMNAMQASVAQRTMEIGIRRTLGARQKDILIQFLTESLVLCLAGGLAGILMGAGASWGIARYAGWPFLFSLQAAGASFAAAAVSGFFFGIHPAMKAAKIDPIDALRCLD